MPKQQNNAKKGFTIIEVVLVLAIAGLIFMMVFIALPALQRSQRDTQRTNDISRLNTQITNYKANNRGRIPTSDSTTTLTLTIDESTYQAEGNSQWANFYNKYLLAGGDTFEDPSGGSYTLSISECKNTGSKVSASGAAACDTQVDELEFDDQYNDDAKAYAITIQTKSTCEGEIAVPVKSARSISMLYKKEGGGVICESN